MHCHFNNNLLRRCSNTFFIISLVIPIGYHRVVKSYAFENGIIWYFATIRAPLVELLRWKDRVEVLNIYPFIFDILSNVLMGMITAIAGSTMFAMLFWRPYKKKQIRFFVFLLLFAIFTSFITMSHEFDVLNPITFGAVCWFSSFFLMSIWGIIELRKL